MAYAALKGRSSTIVLRPVFLQRLPLHGFLARAFLQEFPHNVQLYLPAIDFLACDRKSSFCAEHLRLCERLNLDREHGRQIANDGLPVVARIRAGVDLAARGAEIHAAFVE